MDLKIEYVDIKTIKPYKGNAKKHPKEQIEQIKKSIQEFGNCDPIGIWENEIVEGHGRYLALKQLGVKEVPIIRLDHLTDEQRRAYALVHNKLTMNSPFDDGILSEELENILDIDMSMFDFDEGIFGDEFGTDFSLPDGEKSEFCQMTFHVHERQKELIQRVCKTIKQENTETFGNPNENGNALYEVCKQWDELKKSK